LIYTHIHTQIMYEDIILAKLNESELRI